MSKSSPADDVSQLIAGLQEGRGHVHDSLFENVYSELRRRARGERRRWRGNPSLRTTALVNEAYLKLVNQDGQSWSSRSHFFAVAAKAMRQILINWARRNNAEKRGGGAPKLSLETFGERLGRHVVTRDETAGIALVLDEALSRLENEHPRSARGVEYRFFVGMTIPETAEALGVSTATVSRDWAMAQAWLYREMKRIIAGEPTRSDD